MYEHTLNFFTRYPEKDEQKYLLTLCKNFDTALVRFTLPEGETRAETNFQLRVKLISPVTILTVPVVPMNKEFTIEY